MPMKTVEVMGLPASGKSSQILRLTGELERRGKKVRAADDREIIAAMHTPWHHGLDFLLVLQAMQLERYHAAVADGADVFLFDCGPNNLAAWSYVHYRRGEYDYATLEMLRDLSQKLAVRVDAVIHLSCPIAICVNRHATRTHEPIDDYGLDLQTLKLLVAAYSLYNLRIPGLADVNANRPIEQVSKDVEQALLPLLAP
jgi:hypothetical protein